MTRQSLADAYDELVIAYSRVARELRELEPEVARASVAAAAPSGAPAGAEAVPPAASAPPPRRQPQESAFTQCPAHGQAFQEGRFGLYCSAKGEPDGNWFNDKGYCRVTPKSAGAWLKQHPQGAKAYDPEDVPF